MFKNVIIIGLLAVLLCGATLPLNRKWSNFIKDKCIVNKNEVACIFEDEENKKTSIVLNSGKIIYIRVSSTPYEDIRDSIVNCEK